MKRIFSLVFMLLMLVVCIFGQSMVAYYPFNGNANDASGNNNHPSYIGTGVTLTTDKFNNPNSAYYFDGSFGPTGNTSGSFIRIPADNFPSMDRTVSFWFNADLVGNYPTLFSYGGDGCNASCYIMLINRGNNAAYTTEGHCMASSITANYSITPTNLWKHWVVTTQGATQKIYIDGHLEATTNNYTGPTFVTGKSAVIGALLYIDGVTVYEDNAAKTFQGKLDDIRIYDSAMNDAQVVQLYNQETTGLVAQYPLNGNVHDESVNANHGIVNNATSVADRYGSVNSAYQFNGSLDYLTIPHHEVNTLSSKLTLSAWVKRTEFGIDMILEKGNDWTAGTCNYGIGLHNINNNMFYFFYDGGWRGTNGVNDLNWHHYAVTAENGMVNPILYIDGILSPVLYSGGTTNINLASSSLDIHVGAQVGNLNYYGKNIIDDIKIYNRLLNANEIKVLAEKYVVAHYPFNGNANDESILQNHGTVHNATLTADRFGVANKAYAFTHPNHITVPYHPAVFGDAFTLTYWFKIPSYYGDRGVLSCVDALNGGFQQAFTGQIFSYILGYNFPLTSDPFYSNYTMQAGTNQWHQIVLTYKKTGPLTSETELYLDGELKKSDSHTLSVGFTPNAIFYIGQNHGGLNFQGSLDDIKVYSYILTNSEIQSNYEAEATCTGNTAVITSTSNTGPGTLRAAINCIENGGYINWSPSIDRAIVTSPINIDKNINIVGVSSSERPSIILDLIGTSPVFNFTENAELLLENIDIIIRNQNGSKAISEGSGQLSFSGFTKIIKDPFPLGTVHCDPVYATEIVDVTNPITGKTWMDRNLGASHAATSSTDAGAYGDMYQWGRLADGHQCKTSLITINNSLSDNPGHSEFIVEDNTPYDWRTPENNNLWQGKDGINNPCPNGYRLPTYAEWEAERASWSSNTSAGAFASPLKLPASGNRNGSNGSFSNTGSWGHYWSSSIAGTSAFALDFFGSFAYMGNYGRSDGMCIRCIKD